MAKFGIDAQAIEDLDCGYLIDAVCRYMNATEHPELDGVLAILAIKKVNEDVHNNRE